MNSLKLIKFVLVMGLMLLSTQTLRPTAPISAGPTDYVGTLSERQFKLAEAILKQYAPEAEVHILSSQPLFLMVLGLTNKVGDHEYVVQFNKAYPVKDGVLFHELGHVIDSEDGRLGFKGGLTWNGENCNWAEEWSQRPWEKSAESWRECLQYDYDNKLLTHYDYWVELVWKLQNQ